MQVPVDEPAAGAVEPEAEPPAELPDAEGAVLGAAAAAAGEEGAAAGEAPAAEAV